MISIFVGFDAREAAAYHTFCQSLITKATRPVSIVPLALPLLRDYKETHTDGSNAFIYSRFLVPHLCNFSGWAIFVDGDMVLDADISELWNLRDDSCAVQVVKHDYHTKAKWKYIGTSMQTHNADYPRKNWSSVILWNCAHPANRVLTPEYVMGASGAKLHRFAHLTDDEIGSLPAEWNWLVEEMPPNDDAKLYHYTLGVPGIEHYRDCDHADKWLAAAEATMNIDE